MKKHFYILIAVFTALITYAQAPAGYYNAAAGLTGAPLKTALKTIITNGHQDMGYSGLWTAYATTDRDYYYENDGTILDIYSENPTGADPYNYTLTTTQCGYNGLNYNSEADCYNREHIIPQSFFNDAAPMVSDVHHIRATDGYVNNMRATYPFGKVGTPTFTSSNGSKVGNSISTGYSGTVFEPIDAFKGDVARMIFYFVTRYETQLSGFASGGILGNSAYPGLQNWELQVLMAWHTADPVSAAEIGRNNASYAYQGNRNPFIDNPQWVNAVWGTPDSTPPTAPTNLAASNPTSSSVTLNWTPSTDNVGVASYDIYVNGVYHSTVTGTTAVVSGLQPSTTYSFYVLAKDLAGNVSPGSNTASETTLQGSTTGSCGTENFENIPASSSSYSTRTWTNPTTNITWTATDARTDEVINNGRAILIRNGSLTSSQISGGVQAITVTTKLIYGTAAGSFNLRVNGNIVGTVPYSTTAQTTTVNNINVPGNVVISVTDNSVSGNRVAMDDLTWGCYTLGTEEILAAGQITFYPNPASNGELTFIGKDLKKIQKVDIYSTEGRIVQTWNKPFEKDNKIRLNHLKSGLYYIVTGKFTEKLIVK